MQCEQAKTNFVRGKLFYVLLGTILGSVLVMAAVLPAGLFSLDRLNGSVKPVAQVSEAPSFSSDEAAIVNAVKRAGPAVVHISTTGVQQMPRGVKTASGAGSGVIINPDGYIITNAHVIQDASRIKVTLADGRQFGGILVGFDSTCDVAVVKIDAKELPVASLGDSDKLQTGQVAIAIGSPFSFDGTVTTGVVSATNRTLELSSGNKVKGLIQTDAAINFGNSGGPLVNSSGQVIGINTILFSGVQGEAQGIGFALPINMVRQVADSLIKEGNPEPLTAWLGISMQDITPAFARQYRLPEREGALVVAVMPDSPAEKAGLSPGDIIVEVDEKAVKDTAELSREIKGRKVGSKVNLTIDHAGLERIITAVLE